MEFELLDNEKYIYSRASAKLIDTLLDFPNQFKNAEKVMRQLDLKLRKDYKNVLILGVGNPSSIAFKLLESADINKLKIPVTFCPSIELPSWVNSDTLIIALSHSGNTIEVLDSVDILTARGYQVIAVTGGGRLTEKAAANKNIILVQYHEDLLPRMAIGYAYVLLVDILTVVGALTVKGFAQDALFGLYWDDVENELFKFTRELIPEIKINKNIAKKIAINLYEKIPIIYGCNKITSTVAYRFKTQLCTVAKVFSHYNTIPEINHDEIIGWEINPELRKKFFVLFITDNQEQEKTRKTIELIQGIFLEKDVNYEEIQLKATNSVVRAFKGFFLADWISLYLAILYNVDPNAITLIDKIKKRLEQVERESL